MAISDDFKVAEIHPPAKDAFEAIKESNETNESLSSRSAKSATPAQIRISTLGTP